MLVKTQYIPLFLTFFTQFSLFYCSFLSFSSMSRHAKVEIILTIRSAPTVEVADNAETSGTQLTKGSRDA